MTDDELKAIWKASNERIQSVNLYSIKLNNMNEQIKKFEKTIKTRNNREISAAILVIAGFGYYAFTIPTILGKLGSIWTIGYGIWVIYKLMFIYTWEIF